MHPKNMMGGGKGAAQVVMPNKGAGNQREQRQPARRQRSRSSSRGSAYSHSDSGSETGTDRTPDSSISSRRSMDKGRGGKRRDKRYIEAPGHYGIQGFIPPHQARRHDEHRISDELVNRLPAAPQVPRFPQLPPVDVQQLKADAYAAGVADGRIEEREREDVRMEIAMAQARRPQVPSPRLGRQRSIRLVRPGDVQLRLEDEAMERMQRFRLDDDRRLSDDTLDEANLRAERLRVLEHEERLRREDELVWEELQEQDLRDRELREREEIMRENERERRALEYIRRRETGSDTSYLSSNPFSPQPPQLGRRMSQVPHITRRATYNM